VQPPCNHRAALSRFWVVDLRSSSEFESAHFALTLSLPPERARDPAAREAARDELFAVCAESGVGLAFLTTAEPTDPKGCSGLHPDEVTLVVRRRPPFAAWLGQAFDSRRQLLPRRSTSLSPSASPESACFVEASPR